MMAPPAAPCPNAASVNALLVERYLAVLEHHELARIAQSEQPGVLSGLFLPDVDDAYLQSNVRVMLIGQEPRMWGAGLHTLAAGGCSPAALRAYVQHQKAEYRKFALTPPGRSRFRQFHDLLHASLGSQVAPTRNAIFWGNLLCLSWNRGSPCKASEIDRIAALSQDLLTVQFDVLQPHLVIFATGYRYDRYLKQQVGKYTTLPGIRPRHYWPFMVDALRFQAWRVRHPRRLTCDVRIELLNAIGAAVSLQVDGEGRGAQMRSATGH